MRRDPTPYEVATVLLMILTLVVEIVRLAVGK